MEAIVLAGGFGTRLRSRLADAPKAMAPIRGRPFLKTILDQLLNAGCGRIVLSVGYLHHVIVETFGDEYRGIPLHYVIESTPLGTGGGIRRALTEAVESSVLVLNGDTYLDVNLPELLYKHASFGRPITMTVTEVKDVSRYGGVLIEREHITGFIEKGRTGQGWINAGIYAIDRNFPWPKNLPMSFSFEKEILGAFLDILRPGVVRCSGKFLDIGTPEDFDRAQTELPPGD